VEKDLLITRRDVVRGGSAAITLASASSSMGAAFAQDGGARTATGVVFEDRSGSGRRQPGDPGIAGVLVSNGCEVVKTDHEGRYALPVGDETIIFVIKPTGYAVPVERGVMLPRFYYIHQPQGTPAHLGLRHRGIEPSGALPGAVDFALRKVDEPSRFALTARPEHDALYDKSSYVLKLVEMKAQLDARKINLESRKKYLLQEHYLPSPRLT